MEKESFLLSKKSFRRRARVNVAKRIHLLTGSESGFPCDLVEQSAEQVVKHHSEQRVSSAPEEFHSMHINLETSVCSDPNNFSSNAESQSAMHLDGLIAFGHDTSFLDTDDCTNEESAFDSDSSDNSDSDIEQNDENLSENLHHWAVRFGISLVALSALLCLLRHYHPTLPKDGRTVMKTSRNTEVQELSGGSFYHFGLLKSLQNVIDKVYDIIPDNSILSMQLNIDGLPLFKSSSLQFWPILGKLQGFKLLPFVISLFCGRTKPQSLDEFLSPVIHEMMTLRNGFDHRGKKFFLNIHAIICDTPARAFVKAVKNHTGYYSCDKCTQSGLYVLNRMTFPVTDAPLRTDATFADMIDEDHHSGISPFSKTYLGMVTSFPHDYMHLICLGVVRRLLKFWISGPLRCRLPSFSIDALSTKLVNMKQYIPVEFARKPRSLKELDRWKATELRQFLLYCGPVALHGLLDTEVYKNFLLLFVSIFMLSGKHASHYCEYVKALLIKFVEHCASLYGPEMLVYNVHSVMHLPDDVKIHGCLDSFSGFPFESCLGRLKKLVRKAHLPLPQVVRRLSEGYLSNFQPSDENSNRFDRKHDEGPLPCGFAREINQYKLFFCSDFCLKTFVGDNCVKVGDDVALVRNILEIDGMAYILYEAFSKQECFFDYPLESTDVGIYLLSCLSETFKLTELNSNIQKYVLLPIGSKFVGIPLLHVQ